MLLRKVLAAAAVAAVMGATLTTGPTFAQEKKLTLLTWNLPVYEEKFRGWIADFEELHPDFTVEWLDKKGTEWATFYQTQVVAGTAPDIIDVQGMLWAEYAANDGLVDLTPYLERDPDVAARFNQEGLPLWQMEGRQFMLPYYFSKSLLIYNKSMFAEAGLGGPPENFDQFLDHIDKLSGDEKSGFITLNFDWLYWPLFAMNGVELLTPDLKEAAFNTPEMLEVLTRLSEATQAGHINKIAWTGRWVEPNDAFAAGDIAMYQAHGAALFWVAGRADWVSSDTLGVVPWPGGWGTPNAHGFGISKSTKYPDEAWDFIKIATSDKWQSVMADTFTILTLNKNVDEQLIARIEQEDPLKADTLRLSLENMDRATGNWVTPKDARIKEAFWPPIQAALLGQRDPAEAIAEAERSVNRALRRR